MCRFKKNTFPLPSGTVSLSRRTPLSGVIYIPDIFMTLPHINDQILYPQSNVNIRDRIVDVK